jgi:hypothetical protein
MKVEASAHTASHRSRTARGSRTNYPAPRQVNRTFRKAPEAEALASRAVAPRCRGPEALPRRRIKLTHYPRLAGAVPAGAGGRADSQLQDRGLREQGVLQRLRVELVRRDVAGWTAGLDQTGSIRRRSGYPSSISHVRRLESSMGRDHRSPASISRALHGRRALTRPITAWSRAPRLQGTLDASAAGLLACRANISDLLSF